MWLATYGIHAGVRAKLQRARGGTPTEVPNFSWSIFALYGVGGGSTGCFDHRFQVLALRWILHFSAPKKLIFHIEVGSTQKNALIRPAGIPSDLFKMFFFFGSFFV